MIKIYERNNCLDVILGENCYCVNNTVANLKLAKAVEFLEDEGVLCRLVVNGTKENGYWFDSIEILKESCFVLAKRHTDGHYYSESKLIRNIEGFEILPVGAIYESLIEGVTVKFAVARDFRGEFIDSDWICKVESLEWLTSHAETEYVYLNGKVLTWDLYVETVERNKAEAERLIVERRTRSGFYEDAKSDFGVGRNWD